MGLLHFLFGTHEGPVVKTSGPYQSTIEYWTNPLVGDFVRMKVIKVDATCRCRECGHEWVETVMYRNMEEYKKGLSFELKAHLEI